MELSLHEKVQFRAGKREEIDHFIDATKKLITLEVVLTNKKGILHVCSIVCMHVYLKYGLHHFLLELSRYYNLFLFTPVVFL